ncbi:MAG: hypothetical protein A2X23_00815 [Chloroflexi bacterium GWC2_73_18]|nr:MAG: hypothetical protein A2X23_00815 [Chloroflexi bacterium GWC2_73_18]
MHEAGLIEAALDGALRRASAPAALELHISDPVRVGGEAARFHLELALRARGLGELPVELRIDPVDCPACAVAVVPDPAAPFCPGCGWPLPRRDGPGLEIRARRR